MMYIMHSVVLQALGWKTLEAERKKAKAKMMYKLLNNMGPQSLTNLFTYKNEVTSYNLKIFQAVFVYRIHILMI